MSTKARRKPEAPRLARASVSPPSHDEIAQRAYEIYEASGFMQGLDMEHWLRAEAELAQQRA
jgi:regulation of enolase protein 1 (concanavalin A-like superfamily)